MKTSTISLTTAFLLFLMLSFQNAYSTIWVIDASNYVFTPDDIADIHLGDTVRWVWIEGTHTTTSSVIPDGADAWDSPLSSDVTVFDYVPAVAGVYNYVCTPHAAFGMVGSFSVISSSGLPDLLSMTNITVSPNPFRDRVNIRIDNSAPSYKELKVYDASGKMVRHQSFSVQTAFTSMELQYGDLAPGYYFFEFLDESNKSYVLKMIKE